MVRGTLAIVTKIEVANADGLGSLGTLLVNARSSWGRHCEWALPLAAVEVVIGKVEVGDRLMIAIGLDELRRATPEVSINLAGDEEE